jgi:hypothetical protein
VPPSMSITPCIDCRQEVNRRLLLRDIDRLAGHAGVQCPRRCEIDERRIPFEKVNEAYDRMLSGKVRFRAVLTMGN